MTQQQSPFLEAAYGWNFGESGWNTGMDSNLLKFSFLFDRNVDGIVGSLPSAADGLAYFLTTDNRLYFAVGTTWFSSPTPKWFKFNIKSTGEVYQFDGSSAVQSPSDDDIDSRLSAVELVVSMLGSAAFEDVDFFASQAGLDVISAQANEYTDQLREDLLNSSNMSLGASMVAGTPRIVDSVLLLKGLNKNSATEAALVLGYFDKFDGGGGAFVLDRSDTTSLEAPGLTIVADDGGRWKRVYSGRLTLRQLGCVVDGVTDDYVALNAAMQLDIPLDFGKEGDICAFGTPIDFTRTGQIDWVGNGAVLKYIGTATTSALKITMNEKHTHVLDGSLFVDANQLSQTGWLITGALSGAIDQWPSLLFEGLSAVNVRRHTLALGYGDGIRIDGGFYRVILRTPYVKGVLASVGTMVPGGFGVFGITVSRTGDFETKYLDIYDPYVENVQSDDPAYRFDQDGLRLFSSITAATEAVHNVHGGTVKNVRNRSLKHQGLNGSVVGLRILKQASVVDPGGFGVAPSDWDVEAQYSGVTIRDISFLYEGFGSRGVVRWVGNSVAGRIGGSGIISGVRGEIIGTSVFGIVSITDSEGNSLGGSVSDVNVVGQSDYIVQHLATGTGTPTLSLSNVTAQPAIAGVQEIGAPLGYVLAANVVNTSPAGAVPLMVATSSGNDRRLSSVNTVGFTDTPLISSKGGLVANTAALSVPSSGAGLGGALVLISCGYDRASTCIVAFDNSGATILQQTATRFVAGSDVEPATGDFRLYVNAGNLVIRNRFGASRIITAQVIG